MVRRQATGLAMRRYLQLAARPLATPARALIGLSLAIAALAVAAVFGGPWVFAALTAALAIAMVAATWPAQRQMHHTLAALVTEPVVLVTRAGEVRGALTPADDGAVTPLRSFLAGPQRARALATIAEVIDHDRTQTVDLGLGLADRRVELRMSRYTGDAVLALMHDVTEQRRLDLRMLDEVAKAQQRIGSDLHDGICQQLTGLLLLAQALEGDARRGEPLALADIAMLREHLAASALEVRQVSQSLYPVVLSRHGLVDALRQLCEATAALHRIKCTSKLELQQVRLEGAAIHLYRIAQEALANAVRHARCAAIEVSLTRDDTGALVLEIGDDGVGFVAGAEVPAPGHGMGLHSMHYRAEAIGAWLTITPREGGGTLVRCVLPDTDRTT